VRSKACSHILRILEYPTRALGVCLILILPIVLHDTYPQHHPRGKVAMDISRLLQPRVYFLSVYYQYAAEIPNTSHSQVFSSRVPLLPEYRGLNDSFPSAVMDQYSAIGLVYDSSLLYNSSLSYIPRSAGGGMISSKPGCRDELRDYSLVLDTALPVHLD